jgi:protein-tyrosine-phosphatase
MLRVVRKLSFDGLVAVSVALLAATLALPAIADEPKPQGGQTIVFVCLHGSVKSQMAAAHFNRLARERGLPYTAVSRGIQIDNSIPTRIRDGLNVDGLAPLDDVPRELTAAEASGAMRVVAFDTVPEERRGVSKVTYWTDVPPATKDYEGARDTILRRIDTLVPTLVSQSPAPGKLRGIVASVSEQTDTIVVRLSETSSGGGTTSEFKVQDGLLFDAIRYGDQIEFSVEKINGTNTIVWLQKD